jgi:dynein intermediate chain 2
VATTTKGMHHEVGGWPKNVDPSEPNDIRKEKKKREKATEFIDAQIKLYETAGSIMSENNHIDLFEEYFDGEIPDQSTETLHTKSLRLFKYFNG